MNEELVARLQAQHAQMQRKLALAAKWGEATVHTQWRQVESERVYRLAVAAYGKALPDA